MRAFILGSSGELLDHDLSLLKGERVYASNLAPFRVPEIMSHYVCMDFAMAFLPEFRSLTLPHTKKYYSRNVWNAIESEYGAEIFDAYPDHLIGFSENPYKLYGGGTVAYAMLQLAYHHGAKEIYFLGVDLGEPANGIMDLPEKRLEASILKHKNLRTPFHDKRESPKDIRDYRNFTVKNFIFSRDFLKEKGVEVFNLSKGGYLNCFQRLNYEDVVKERVYA